MRIRTIKPEFFLHEELYEAEKASRLPCRLAFAGLWCAADRDGRFKWEPRKLGIQILPYDNVDFSRVLDALTTRGFVRRYASGTAVFGWIPGFQKHQVINNKEKPSDLPEPNDTAPESAIEQQPDACLTRERRDDHANATPLFLDQGEGKGREGNKEGKGITAKPTREKRTGPHAEFIHLWTEAYQSHFDRAYNFTDGKDGTAVKRILAIPNITIPELIAVAKQAWGRTTFHCKRGLSIAGFSCAYNDIRGELDDDTKAHAPNPDSGLGF